MSKENVQKFYELLTQDAAVAEKLKKAVEGIDSAEKAVAAVIELGKAEGFIFSAEDIAEFEQENQKELSPDELENIVGGAWGACLLIGVGDGNAGGEWGVSLCKYVGVGLGYSDSDYKSEKNPAWTNRHNQSPLRMKLHPGTKVSSK